MSRIANIIYCFREWDLQKVCALSSYHQALFNYIITELVQVKNLSNQISGNNRQMTIEILLTNYVKGTMVLPFIYLVTAKLLNQRRFFKIEVSSFRLDLSLKKGMGVQLLFFCVQKFIPHHRPTKANFIFVLLKVHCLRLKLILEKFLA